MARTAYTDNNEELRKVITAVALAGDRMMLIDNVPGVFGGSALDAALTATSWKERLLGVTKMTPDLPLYAVWYATGNNLTFRGDAPRRVVPCRLEPQEERPEERGNFSIPNLRDHVLKHRGRLLAAVLTTLRGFICAGRPQPQPALTPLGSYEDWSEIVRAAVHWVLGCDPCAAQVGMRAQDSAHKLHAALLDGWTELPGAEKGLTAREALETLRSADSSKYQILRDVFAEWSKTAELPNAAVVGNRLKAVRGRVQNGKAFVPAESEDRKGAQRWRVKTL